MSKGSKQRPTNQTQFSKNFDNIKWSGKTKDFTRPKTRVNKSARVWSDIEPYKAVGGDVAGKYITNIDRGANNCLCTN